MNDFLVKIIVKGFLRKFLKNGRGIIFFAVLSILMKTIAFLLGLVPEICTNYGWLCNPTIVLVLSTVNDFLIYLLRLDTDTKPGETREQAKLRILKENT